MKRRRRWFRLVCAIGTLGVVCLIAVAAARISSRLPPIASPDSKAAIADIDLVSSRAVLDKLAQVGTVTLAAYSLQYRSLVVRDLEAASDRGSQISVALSRGFGMYVSENEKTAGELRSHRVRVHILEGTSQSIHLKAAILDGELYLTDRNWTNDPSEEIVVHDSIAGDRTLIERAILGQTDANDHLWTRKADALAAEGQMLQKRESHLVRVSSESFGGSNPVYDELVHRKSMGDQVDLLVARAEYSRSRSEQSLLRSLVASGVDVRLLDSNEKFAVDGDSVWIGSSNATHGAENQIDFGLVLSDEHIARELADQFDREWRRAEAIATE